LEYTPRSVRVYMLPINWRRGNKQTVLAVAYFIYQTIVAPLKSYVFLHANAIAYVPIHDV